MRAVPLLVALFLPCFTPADAACVPLRATKIALAGEETAGVAGGTYTESLFGRVNDAGQVALTARIARTGQSGTVTGIWTWNETDAGAPAPLAVPGPAPAGPAGAELSGAFVRSLTASGKIGYQASYRVGPGGVTSSSNTALARYDPLSGHALLVRSGDPAPGVPGQVFVVGVLADVNPELNDAGVMAFPSGTFAGPPLVFGGGLWTADGTGPPTPVVIAGEVAPGDSGLAMGTPLLSFLNDAGQIAFSTGLGSGPSGSAATGIFGSDASGGFYEVARTGAQAPGAPEGALLQAFPGGGFFSQSDAGAVGFAARLVVGAGGVTAANDWGLWRSLGPGDTTLLFRADEAAPGAPPGAVFDHFDGIALNDSGAFAFSGKLALGKGGVTNVTDSGIWGPDGAGGTRLVAREGDPIAILPGETWGGLFGVLLSDDGALFFEALSGGQRGLFYVAPSGELRVVIRTGDEVDLGGGDVRTVQTLIDWSESDDLRRYAVTTRFTDGSAGLLLVTIPEPGSAALLGLGLVLLARRRRALPARG